MNKIYYKIIDNKAYYATPLKGSALIGNCWVSNPTEEMLLADGWQEYIPEPHIRTLEEAKNEKINELQNYAKSSEINQFFIGNTAIILTDVDRVALQRRISAEEAEGKTTTTFWYANVAYEMTIEEMQDMLNKLEVYASECYDCTSNHKVIILNLTTIEVVDNYNYKTGYPEKLSFDI